MGAYFGETPGGLNFFVSFSTVVKKKQRPEASLTVVGPCPLKSPRTPCFLRILIAASRDPVYILSACPLWICILILVCSTIHWIMNNLPQKMKLQLLLQGQPSSSLAGSI